MKTLGSMENIFGNDSSNIKKRVLNYFNNPTVDTWDDIHSLIIDSNLTTIWEAVLDIHPGFPVVGRVYDENDNIVEEWKQIPLPFDVLRAIKKNTQK